MKNLKKTLAVVLAFAMVMSMGLINTFAYSDVEAGTLTDEAVSILSNLGIFTGFEDGTFKPEDTVTRAQMAAIICRTLGYEDQAQSSGGATVFNDVAADHWAAGYINVAQAQGIINGYGDGNFGPEDQVTYEQAVKMIVSALGYDLMANNKGGYPSGYLAIASSEGITKSANGKVGDPAKRGTIAILVYNSLEVRIMDQSSWTSNGEDEFAKTDDTILSKYLEVEKWEGIVADVPFMEYAKSGYDVDSDLFMTVYGFESYYQNGYLVKDDSYGSVEADCSLVDADSLLGKYVVAYISEDEDDETGNRMVYAVTEKQSKNKVTTISGTQLVDEDDKEYNINNQISYRNTGSSKVYDLDIESGAVVLLNYEPTILVTEDENQNTVRNSTKALDEALEVGGSIQFISNDSDDKIEYIVITAYNYGAVIEDVTEEEGIYSFDLFTGDLDDIDTEDEDELVVIYKNGELVDVTALAANDTVYTVDLDKTVRVLYVSDKTVTGAVTAYDKDDNTVTIDGVDYDCAFGMDAAKLKDEEGTFFLDVDGQIVWNETDPTAGGNYGILLAANYETGITDGYVMQVAMQDGTIAEYDLSTKAKLYDANGNTKATDDDGVFEKLTGFNAKDTKVYKTTVATVELYKFTIKNGEITKIKVPDGTTRRYDAGNGKKYDADSNSYASADFDDNTVVFAIDEKYDTAGTALGDKIVDDDNISVGSVADYFSDEDDNLTFAYFTEDGDDYATVVVGYDLTATVPQDSDAVIISAVKTVTYDDDDAVQITGIQAGKEVSFILYDDDNEYKEPNKVDPEDLGKGDIILIGAIDGEGVVNRFERLLAVNLSKMGDTKLEANAETGDKDDDIYNTFANVVNEATSSKFWINKDVTNNSGANTWAVKEDGISMKSSANYTLVDCTESIKNPEISKKSAGTSLFNNKKYDAYAFVRVYDDALTEVVVYRFEKAN